MRGALTAGLVGAALVLAPPAQAEELAPLPDADCLAEASKRVATQRFVICVDAGPDIKHPTVAMHHAGGSRSGGSPLHLRPDQTIVVVVAWEDGAAAGVEIDVGGTPGVWAGEIRQRVVKAQGLERRLLSRAHTPRLPGALDVTVTFKDAEAETISATKQGLLVRKEFVGALRVGLGIYGSPLHVTYGTAARGAGSAEVVRTREWDAGFEIVVAYSLWGEPRLVDELPGKPGFYVGVGLGSAGASGLGALSAFHVGVEIALNKDVSLALVGSVRFGVRLADGFSVGSPLAAGTTVETTPIPLPGFGLVFNVSPDFMKTVKAPGG